MKDFCPIKMKIQFVGRKYCTDNHLSHFVNFSEPSVLVHKAACRCPLLTVAPSGGVSWKYPGVESEGCQTQQDYPR